MQWPSRLAHLVVPDLRCSCFSQLLISLKPYSRTVDLSDPLAGRLADWQSAAALRMFD